MCHRVGTTMPCEPASVPAARRWAAGALAEMYDDPGEAAADAALVVSELVSNCVRADAHEFKLALEGHHASLRVETTDDAPGMPTPRQAQPQETSGRGLLIIQELAEDWGVQVSAASGKTVWAELGLPDRSAARFSCEHG